MRDPENRIKRYVWLIMFHILKFWRFCTNLCCHVTGMRLTTDYSTFMKTRRSLRLKMSYTWRKISFKFENKRNRETYINSRTLYFRILQKLNFRNKGLNMNMLKIVPIKMLIQTHIRNHYTKLPQHLKIVAEFAITSTGA